MIEAADLIRPHVRFMAAYKPIMPFEVLSAQLGLPPQEIVMIGDRATDIAAGKANGTRTLAVTYGFGDMEELTAAQPDQICHSPDEIGQALTGAGTSSP